MKRETLEKRINSKKKSVIVRAIIHPAADENIRIKGLSNLLINEGSFSRYMSYGQSINTNKIKLLKCLISLRHKNKFLENSLQFFLKYNLYDKQVFDERLISWYLDNDGIIDVGILLNPNISKNDLLKLYYNPEYREKYNSIFVEKLSS